MSSKTQCSSEAGWRFIAFIFFCGIATAAVAQPTNNPVFAARAGAEFHRAQIQLQSDTNDFAAAWHFARACYDFADFATSPSKASLRVGNCSRTGSNPRRDIITLA
jgi:hypothetical protein